jgi:hypothetical protein
VSRGKVVRPKSRLEVAWQQVPLPHHPDLVRTYRRSMPIV